MSLRSSHRLLISGLLESFAWQPPCYTQGIENKIAPTGTYKFGAKPTTYTPSPGGPARGKRRRQWR